MTVAATITVDFGGGTETPGNEQAYLMASVDSADGGLNGGKTSFLAGEQVYFCVWQSDNVRHDFPIASIPNDGVSIGKGPIDAYTQSIPDATRKGSAVIQFANTKEASLPVPVASLDSFEWQGRQLGAITLHQDKQTVQSTVPGVAVAKVTFTRPHPVVYRLRSPVTLDGQTDFTILIYIRGEVIQS